MEQANLVVVAKPAGEAAEEIVEAVRLSCGHAVSVSRLDLATSGCMVVPTTEAAGEALTAAFRERAVTKVSPDGQISMN